MALKLGELAAVLTVDDTEFDRRLDRAKKDFGGFGDKLKASAAAVGIAVAAALGAGLVQSLNVEQANDKLAAQLSSTPAEAERLGKIAGDLYAGAWGDSMTQVNDAIRSVIQNLEGMQGATDQVLQDTTAAVIDLGTAFEQDVGQTSRAVGKLIRTGLARDAQEALDLLTRGFQTGANEADDLLDTVAEYSTMFRDIGLDGKQALGLISQGLQAGARDADTVADALKEFAIRAQDGSDASAAGFEAIGLNAEKMTAAVARGGPAAEQALGTVLDRLRAMKDPAERNAAAVALFGTKAEDLGDALFALDLGKATKELGDVEGAAGRMGDTLNDNANTVLTSFKREAQAALVEKLAAAVPHIKAVATWMGEHKAIVVPLATVLGTFAAIIGVIVAATKIWTITQAALNVVMMLNPLGLIILAIVALIGIIVLIATKTTWFQDLWKAAWGAIKGAAMAVWNWIKENWPLLLAIITGPIGLAVLLITKNWDKIKAGAKVAKDWIVDRWNQLVGFITGLPRRVARAASGMWNGITSSFRSAINWVIGRWNGFSLTLGGGSVMGVPIPSVTLSTPNIPFLAEGGRAVRPGLAVVGERGPELLHMQRGATVQPLDHGGMAQLRGTILIKGDGILEGLRQYIQINGGDVEAVLGG